MNSEQAREQARKLRALRQISPLAPDQEDWLWEYEHGYLILND